MSSLSIVPAAQRSSGPIPGDSDGRSLRSPHPWLAPTIVVLAFGIADAGAAGSNRWTSRGPHGGDVFAIWIDPEVPQTVYAGTEAGLYRSLDGALRWTQVDGPRGAVWALAADEAADVLYAGGDGGVWRSLDRGTSWLPLGRLIQPRGDPVTVFAVTLSPVSLATLIVGTDAGVYRSTDGGDSWSAVNEGLDCGADPPWIQALVVHPEAPSLLYAGAGAHFECGVYRSTDGGDNWSAVNEGLVPPGRHRPPPIGALAIDPTDPLRFYAGALDGGVYRSVDGGDTWTRNADGPPGGVLSLRFDRHDPSILYAGSLGRAYRSTDRGESWARLSDDSPSAVRALEIDPSDSSRFYAGTLDGGVQISTDGGEHWIASSEGLFQPAVTSMAVDPEVPTTVWAATERGVFRSLDAGHSWSPRSLGLHHPPGPVLGTRGAFGLALDPLDTSDLYVTSSRALWRSADSGGSWDLIFSSLFIVTHVAVHPQAPDTLLVGDRLSVLRSIDGGRTWRSFFSDNRGFAPQPVIAPSPPFPVYVHDSSLRLYRSTDSDGPFTPAFEPGAGPGIRGLTVDPRDPFVLYARVPAGVSRSLDGGATWSAARGLGGNEVRSLAVDPRPAETPAGSTVYAGTEGAVYRSIDGGQSWWPLPALDRSTTAEATVDALAIAPMAERAGSTTLYAGTSEGVQTIDLIDRLELHGGRFQVEVEWREFRDLRGTASVVAPPEAAEGPLPLRSAGSAVVEFFAPDNWEMLIKVLDGRALSGHFWVFFAAATNVAYSVQVTDTACGDVRVYDKPLGISAPAVTDTEALPDCASPSPPSCTEAEERLCLGEGGRFQVEVAWQDFLGNTGVGRQAHLAAGGLAESRESGLLTFFAPDNWEVLVKVIDGCRLNDRFWVFAAATTDVEYELRVTDTATGERRTYRNPLGVDSPDLTDTGAFASCAPPPPLTPSPSG